MDAAKRERLGKRWACYSCGGKFYDLNRTEVVCPRCGADQRKSRAQAAGVIRMRSPNPKELHLHDQSAAAPSWRRQRPSRPR